MSENNIVANYTLDEIRAMRARGDDKTRTDAPEAEPLGNAFWKHARRVNPRDKTEVRLRLDADLLEWFRAEGEKGQLEINEILRSYVDARKGRLESIKNG